jgi:anti-anti-sigma factor
VVAKPESHDPPVGFAVEVDGAFLRVTLRGELDLACAELFDSLFDLETEGIMSVVLDLGALTFCDVSGVNALTGLQSFHRCHGRTAELADVQPQVRRLMTLMETQPRPLSGGTLSG